MTYLAFTGTRRGLTPEQRSAVETYLRALGEFTFLFGACKGADREAAHIALNCGGHLIAYPGDMEQATWAEGKCWHNKIMPYPVRNRRMVERTQHLLACPGSGIEERRSGTWATIRHARKLKRPITIIWPSGMIE